MANGYRDLLEATVQHFEDQRLHGSKFVVVSPATLAALAAPRPVNAAAPRKPPPTSLWPIGAKTQPDAGATPSRANAPRSTVAPVGESARTPTAAPPTPPAPLSLGFPGKKAMTAAEKEAAIAALRQRALACRKCSHLAATRKNVVFGVGSAQAQLMFIGEAPGADEDEQAEPFVGRAGQLLTRIIETMGLSRAQVYIANILKCRPDTPAQTPGNRKPTPTEMVTCLPYLLEQIEIIQPQVIVGLGTTAVEGLLGKTQGVTRIRGRWLEFRGVPFMPTYHPAYLLRKQAPGEKRKVWEDMLQVMEKLGLPISQKQRNYFLKA